MRLPAFAPVLARPDSVESGGTRRPEIQVGLASPVRLSGLGMDERAFVASLEGGRAVTPHERQRFAAVIAQLSLAGAWVGEAPRPPAVALHGCGALGLAIATALGAAGARVALCDDAPADAEPLGTFGAHANGTCAGASARVLADRGIPASVGTEGLGEVAAIAVVVFAGAPDPVLSARLLHGCSPHVLVACDEEGVVVSHVVVPGVTACSRCRDIALTRDDPAWPYLALQLAGSRLRARRPRAQGLAGPAAALRVAMRVADWLETGDTGTAERVAPNGTSTEEAIAPEPGCGCGAAGPVGDELASRRAAWRPTSG